MAAESENGDVRGALDYTAHPPPPPGSSEKPAAASSSTLTPAQTAMHKKMLEHFQSESYKIPDIEDGELLEVEKFWLSNDCMLRYLRATKWNSAKVAIERLEGTLKWRREFGVYDLTAEHVEHEAVTGKMITFGYDTHRRPALYMMPSRQNTEDAQGQIEFAIWMLERALDLTGPGVESVVLMINFADKAKNPSFAIAKSMLNIFQMHYPERLAESLIINVPFLIHAFFKMISPFMDPVTRNKLKFNPNPVRDGLFTADELFKESGWGGSRDFVWDHEKYWPAFVGMCDEIVEGQMARWRKLGARVGCDEKDYKSEDVVHTVPGSPGTGTSKVEAEATDGAAPDTGEVVEELAFSQAEDQTRDETPATEEDLEPTAI